MSKKFKPYPGDRVRTPYSEKTVGTVTTVKLSEAGKPVCLVQFDRPCGPGPDSEAWFDSRDLKPAGAAMLQAEGPTTDEGKNDKWWFAQLDAARKERDEAIEQRDEAIEKLRRAVRVLIGVGDGVNHES